MSMRTRLPDRDAALILTTATDAARRARPELSTADIADVMSACVEAVLRAAYELQCREHVSDLFQAEDLYGAARCCSHYVELAAAYLNDVANSVAARREVTGR